MTTIATSALDLARWQFAITTLFHFTFVPLTLGLGPFLAIMQTRWYRTGDVRWLRLVRFFGALFLINFAIGAATGLVQEFEFGMNWSHFSSYVGDVFGSPLALEGLGAFFLESTFIGLWIFGWNRLSPKLHLLTIYLVWAGTWLSAYFIIAANSWMQHPVGYTINTTTDRAQATDIGQILFQRFALVAYVHVILAGLMVGGFLVLGVSCWHLLKGRNVDLMSSAAKLAIMIVLPVSVIQLGWGSEFGVEVTRAQPMKIAGGRGALEHDEVRAVLDRPDRRVHRERPDAVVLDRDTRTAVVPGDQQLQGHGRRPDAEQRQRAAAVRIGELHPGCAADLLEHARDGLPRDALAAARRVGVLPAALAWRPGRPQVVPACRGRGHRVPVPLGFAGWVLTEAGRQPWVAWGLLKTKDAVSPSVSMTTVAAEPDRVRPALHRASGRSTSS